MEVGGASSPSLLAHFIAWIITALCVLRSEENTCLKLKVLILVFVKQTL